MTPEELRAAQHEKALYLALKSAKLPTDTTARNCARVGFLIASEVFLAAIEHLNEGLRPHPPKVVNPPQETPL